MSNQNHVSSPVEIAYFRFGVIAPVIQGTFPDASEAAFYRRVALDELTLPDGSHRKYSPDTFEKWTSLYRKSGMDGLMPKGRSDKGVSRTIDDAAAEEIDRYQQFYPHASGVAIHAHLVENGFIPATVSVRAVQRFLKEKDMYQPRDVVIRERRAFEMARFGQMWQADTAYLPNITGEDGKPRRTFVIMIVDDHSRMIVGGEIFYHDNAKNFQKVLKDAIASYGIPDKVLLDNGSPYKNGQLTFILGNLAIKEKHARVRDGATKGKVERNFRTLRSRFIATLDMSQIHSLEQFNDLLSDYIETHNKTYHNGINERPIDRYLATKNYIRIPKSRDWLEEAFYNRDERKVREDSVIKIDNEEYDVPAQFAGKWVEIRFNPTHMKDAYILYNGTQFPITLTDRVKNGNTRRNSNQEVISYRATDDTTKEAM